MKSDIELSEIVYASIKQGSDFYREFSSRFFGSLMGEMMIARVEQSDSMKLAEITKIAKKIYDEEMQKADTSGKVTA